MKVSLKWLKTMIDVPSDIKAFTERLDVTGTAVDSVSTSGAALDGIVVGHIKTRDKHPDADKLWVTTVDVGGHNVGEDGEPEVLQIVCGAQNFNAGDKVPVALVGATLPDGNKIKKAKMRGVESRGMNCSARELGLGKDHAGLMILEPDAVVGTPISEHLGLSDVIVDLEITSNRPDCMSMLGVAREVGAVYNLPYNVGRKMPEPTYSSEKASDLVRVTIEDSELCPRYTARVLKGVKIGPSPDWLAQRVIAAGARSINNIVDATNYIMFELGQPLHAFDLDTLVKDADGKAHIVVKAAKDGEKFTTLDDVERVLDSDITCIVDGNAAGGSGVTVALAGVMGGLDSEITDNTVNILLESATFSNSHTSRTSRKLQLFSESSARYERGVDGASCDDFSARAAALMIEVAGGELCEGVVDVFPAPVQMPELVLRMQRMQDLIGAPIAVSDARAILTRLGCEVKDAVGGDDLIVVAPTYRPDLTREIDLYEEVLRIWGMDRVESTLPGGRLRIGEKTLEQHRLDAINRTLRACGLNETMTYVFTSPEDCDNVRMTFADNQQAVELINPMNSDQSQLRRTILPGLLRSVAYNLNHGVTNVHLYETGAVFYAAEGRKLPKERQMLCGVLVGSWHESGWNTHASQLSFFDGKGAIENLLRELNIVKTRFKALDVNEAPWLQPGRAAEILAASKQIGWLGEVHPQVLGAFDISVSVVAFELDVKALIDAAGFVRPYKDVPQYPAVSLDLALVVSEDVTAEKVMQVISSAGGQMLDELRLFDVYRDAEKLGLDKKSLAFGLSYRAADRTLTAEEVERLHQKVVTKVIGATKGEVRA